MCGSWHGWRFLLFFYGPAHARECAVRRHALRGGLSACKLDGTTQTPPLSDPVESRRLCYRPDNSDATHNLGGVLIQGLQIRPTGLRRRTLPPTAPTHTPGGFAASAFWRFKWPARCCRRRRHCFFGCCARLDFNLGTELYCQRHNQGE